MAFWRRTVKEFGKEVAAHAGAVDDIANLQQMQKELSDAMARLNDRFRRIEIELEALRAEIKAETRALKAEVKLDAMDKVQQVVNSVQGALYEKTSELTIRVSHLERDRSPIIALQKSATARSEPSELPPA